MKKNIWQNKSEKSGVFQGRFVFLLSLCILSFAAAPQTASAGVLVNGADSETGSGAGWTYSSDTGVLTLSSSGPFVLSGSNTAENFCVSITAGSSVVTVSNLVISSSKACAVSLADGIDAEILLVGTSRISSGPDNPGIRVSGSSKLTINAADGDPDASLYVSGGHSGAGIGGGFWEAAGHILILGGTITANGGTYAAGIGGGETAGGGYVEIMGGTVSCRSEAYGAGIGGGYKASGGIVKISGGISTVSGGTGAAGIGGGLQGGGGSVEISGGTVIASAGAGSYENPAADIGRGAGGDDGENIFSGGSIIARGSSVLAGPADSAAKPVYSVELSGFTADGPVAVRGVPVGYGTADIYPVGGIVCLWLSDGDYVVSDGTLLFRVHVSGSAVKAQGSPFPSAEEVGILSFSLNGQKVEIAFETNLSSEDLEAWLSVSGNRLQIRVADSPDALLETDSQPVASDSIYFENGGSVIVLDMPDGAASQFYQLILTDE